MLATRPAAIAILWISVVLSPGAQAQRATSAGCLPDEMDVVDAHSHFFNLDALPEKGILYRYGVPWPLSPLVARLLHRITPRSTAQALEPLDSLDEAALKELVDETLFEGAGFELSLIKAYKLVLRSALTRAARSRDGAEDLEIDTRYPGRSTEELLLELVYVSHLRGDDDPESLYSTTDSKTVPEKVAGAINALRLLTSSEKAIVGAARAAFPDVDLFVHHLMDMERPYDDVPPVLFEEQIDLARGLDADNPGRLRFFVAYDPFRRDNSLVTGALSKKGALGAKLYPPNGSRPACNCVPPEPRFEWPITPNRAQRKQWKARYEGWGPDRIDRLNRETFQQAAWLGKAIFSHHNKSGVTVGDTWNHVDYGEVMGAPCHWQTILHGPEPHPTVILAHAGGTGSWFGKKVDEWESEYALQAYNMCVSYENVYCDFGGASRILDERERARFVKRLERLFSKPTGPPPLAALDLCTLTEEVVPQYPLSEKILYGSDWLVSIEEKRNDYLCRFNDAFESSRVLAPHRAKFFGANAREAFFPAPAARNGPSSRGTSPGCSPTGAWCGGGSDEERATEARSEPSE